MEFSTIDSEMEIEHSMEKLNVFLDNNLFKKDYQCQKKVGQGGFGSVYNAFRLSDKEKVVVKLVEHKRVPETYFWKKHNMEVPIEVVLLSKCQNIPGVVKLNALYREEVDSPDNIWWYLVFEKTIGPHLDLFDFISKARHLSESDAALILEQLIGILLNCRKVGVLHRDIKDENILVELETRRIHLIDFGSGAFFNPSNGIESANFTKFDGTRVYSPPEWIKYKKYNGGRLESWSIGILLFDMVCGDVPFNTDEQILFSKPIYRTTLSKACRNLIQGCLAKDPSARINLEDIDMHEWLQHSQSARLLAENAQNYSNKDKNDFSSIKSQSFQFKKSVGFCHDTCNDSGNGSSSYETNSSLSSSSSSGEESKEKMYSQTIPEHFKIKSAKKPPIFYISDEELDGSYGVDETISNSQDNIFKICSPNSFQNTSTKKLSIS